MNEMYAKSTIAWILKNGHQMSPCIQLYQPTSGVNDYILDMDLNVSSKVQSI